MNREFIEAIQDLSAEKHINPETLFTAVDSALISAYKKNYGDDHNCIVNIDRETGQIRVFSRKLIVHLVYNPVTEISLADAKKSNPAATLGGICELDATPADFSKIATSSAKQIIVQHIREAENQNKFKLYAEREGQLAFGTFQRNERNGAIIDIDGEEALLPPEEQIKGEQFKPHDRIRVYVFSVKQATKRGEAMMRVSRTHAGLLRKLFEREITEVSDGTIEIVAIAREAGSRSKIAVKTDNENVDPVGACIGQKGARINKVLEEIGQEKIDVVRYEDDPIKFIQNALAPAKIEKISLDPETKCAVTYADKEQLTLAIGKQGQNVRLAARLTGWKIDIKSDEQAK